MKVLFFLHFVNPSGKTGIPQSPALVHTRAGQRLAVDGCCEAAAYGIRLWTPWIWGILDFRSIRVIATIGPSSLAKGTLRIDPQNSDCSTGLPANKG